METNKLRARALAVVALSIIPTLAWSHPGHEIVNGLAAGWAHPLSGLDHLLAMIAVGLWATQLGGRAVGLAPATFLVSMCLGAVLAAAGMSLPIAEAGIAASVLILGLLIAVAARLPAHMALPLIGLFALFHGYAHQSGVTHFAASYVAGFLAATAALHIAGVAIGIALQRHASANAWRWLGSGITLSGVVLAFA